MRFFRLSLAFLVATSGVHAAYGTSLCPPLIDSLARSGEAATVARQLVDLSLKKGGHPFHDAETYALLEKHPDFVAAYVKKHYQKFRLSEHRATSVPWRDSELETLRKAVGDRDFSLFVDPGIMARRQEFLGFRREFREANPTASALELRSAFSDHLGTIKLYRGISDVDFETAKSIFEKGMEGNFFTDIKERAKLSIPASQESSLDNLWSGSGVLGEIKKKTLTYDHSLILPVSPHKSLAETFARPFHGGTGFLFELEVPILDVYDYSFQRTLGWDYDQPTKKKRVLFDGMPFPELESLVLSPMDPRYLRGVTEWSYQDEDGKQQLKSGRVLQK
ncbi:MAG TPA: hypothetical protein VM901_11280 [Bdellovibrionota bacterium]|nr:hypothetical protein [Bdellovibrionota bacterium]